MKIEAAIERICEILEHPQYPQIQGHLITFGENKQCIGKCALGEISCQVGLKLDYDHSTYLYEDILKAVGVPEEYLKDRILPRMSPIDYKGFKAHGVEFDFTETASDLDEYIFTLNDTGYTYSEIREFLRCTFL